KVLLQSYRLCTRPTFRIGTGRFGLTAEAGRAVGFAKGLSCAWSAVMYGVSRWARLRAKNKRSFYRAVGSVRALCARPDLQVRCGLCPPRPQGETARRTARSEDWFRTGFTC